MKKFLQTLLYAFVVFGATAQDPHLSQYYMAPMYLNPALTGAFDGNYRVSGLYRGQWASVLQNEATPLYRTYTFSADFRTDRGFGKGDAFGFGGSFFADQAGESQFGYNMGQLAIAYHKSLNGRHTNYLALGFSSQIIQQSLNFANLQWGSQWDPTIGGYNALLPSHEFIDNNKLYWDINAGLLWYMQIGRRHRSDVFLGVSAYHINTPVISMLSDNSVKLNMKYIATGGMRFPLIGRFDLQPKFIFMMQGQSIETILSADVRVLFEEKDPGGDNFRFGAMFRMVGGDPSAPWKGKRLNPEAAALTAGVEWNHINLGIAYDINVSQLISGSNSRGGFEIAANYVGRWKKHGPTTIYCPKF